MSKIRSSILLLTSFFVFSCINNQINKPNQKYSLAYIAGEYDGLLLKNYLMSELKSANIYDQSSNIKIQASIEHDTNLFITNIDNTSDREKIISTLTLRINNTRSTCLLYTDEITISQFYIFASSDKFLSNQTAIKKIKKSNTESLVRKFIHQLKNIDNQCAE